MLVFGFLAALQALAVVGAATLQKRTNDFINAIAEPTAGTVIQPGQTFPFQYVGGSRCNLLYTGVRIYIFPDQPTLSDFDDNGVPVVSYLYSYGEYVHINIAGVPNWTDEPVVPNNLTTPTLDPSYLGKDVYLTTTQSENGGCPPYYPTGFDASFVELQYGSA